jgi:hypothetical protein
MMMAQIPTLESRRELFNVKNIWLKWRRRIIPCILCSQNIRWANAGMAYEMGKTVLFYLRTQLNAEL